MGGSERGSEGNRARDFLVALHSNRLMASNRVAPARRILITGGAGFIGSHLADALLARGEHLVLLDDFSTGRRENIQHLPGSPEVELVDGSTLDFKLVDRLVSSTDVTLHLASAVGVQLIVSSPLSCLLGNVRGTDNVFAAAVAHGKRLLFTSTSEVYGKQTRSGLSEDADLVLGSPAKGRWAYAISKSAGEALAHAYHREKGLESIVVRLFNTVGPRQSGSYGMVLPRFVGQALRGDDLTIFGSGTQTRCFVHVADTVRAIDLLCQEDRAVGNVYNIGNPRPVAIAELARRVIERSGSTSHCATVPYAEAYPAGFEELGDRVPDISTIRDLTSWQPMCTLDDAIDDVIAYERWHGTHARERAVAYAR